ncbi:MAG: PQQ-like beta-propeller repeat protein [Actinobacteria bacterium]|nr:PQQ-like beta-propeller repeat protein [Actinomycetota bacterium]MBU2687277.1 PQQ-like beta-propeller repeat protein [Actinomycetota bacterium]
MNSSEMRKAFSSKRLRFAALFLISITLAESGCSCASVPVEVSNLYRIGWPQELHDGQYTSHTGTTIRGGATASWIQPLADSVELHRQCLVGEDTVISSWLDSKGQPGLCGLDLEDGRVLWKKELEPETAAGPFFLTAFGLVLARSGQNTNSVELIDPKSGQTMWLRDVEPTMSRVCVTNDEIVLVLNNREVVVLEARDGSIRTRAELESTRSPGNQHEPKYSTSWLYNQGVIYLGFPRTIEAFRTSDGRLKWIWEVPSEHQGMLRFPVDSESSMMAYLENAPLQSYEILSIDKSTGTTRWIYHGLSLTKSSLLLSNSGPILVEINPEPNTEPESGHSVLSIRLLDESSGVASDLVDYDYGISDLSKTTIVSSVVAGADLFVTAGDGHVVRFPLNQRRTRSSFEFDGDSHIISAGYNCLIVTSLNRNPGKSIMSVTCIR